MSIPMLDTDMFRFFRKPEKGEFYLTFLDTAGEGSDWNAAHFLSKNKLDIPTVLHYQGSVVDVTPQLHIYLEWLSDTTGVNPVVCYETNNGGGYELERLARLNTNRKYDIYYQYQLDEKRRLVRTNKMGWNTNSATRPVMLEGVKDVMNNSLVKIYDQATIDEAFSFVKHKTPSGWRAEAESGSTDDLIMALAGVWQLYQTETAPEQDDEEYETTGNITTLWRA